MAITDWLEYYEQKQGFANLLCCNNIPNWMEVTSSTQRNGNIDSISNQIFGENIILFHQDNSGRIGFLHNINNIQNQDITFNQSEPRIVALSGFSQPTPVVIKNSEISKISKLKTPSFEDIMGANNEQEFLSLQAGDNGFNFDNLNFLILPSFLWTTVITSRDKSPFAVLSSIKTATNEFIEKHTDDERFVTEGLLSKLGKIFQFCWLVAKKKIPSLPFSIAIEGTDDDVWNWSKMYINQRTRPATTTQHNNNPLATNTTNIENHLQFINDFVGQSFDHLKALQSDASTNKKSFDSIFDPFKTMILNASAANREIAATEPSEMLSKIIKAKAGIAQLMLIEDITSRGCSVQVDIGVVRNIQIGNLLRNFQDKPSNFSFFSFPKKSLSYNPTTDALEYNLRESSKNLKDEDIQKCLLQKVDVVYNIDILHHYVKNTWAASCALLGENSICSDSILYVVNHVNNNQSEYEVMQAIDPQFATKFLWMLDCHLQTFLKQCKKEQDREFVDDNIINFIPICNQVSTQSFTSRLPKFLRDKFDRAERAPQKPGGNLNKKARNDNASEILTNTNMVEEWRVSRDKFQEKFAGQKELLKDRPKINGNPICHRFLIRGQCFKEGCNNSITHLKANEISNESKKEIKKWRDSVLNNSS